MSTDQIITQLQSRYPNRQIILLPEVDPTEIICETEPATLHPEWSKIVAVISKSAPHVHKVSTETYRVLRGTLTLSIDGQEIVLNESQIFTIQPGQVHSAKGEAVWVEVISRPGWQSVDHMLI